MDAIKIHKILNKYLIDDLSNIVIENLYYNRSEPIYIVYRNNHEDISIILTLGIYNSIDDACYGVKSDTYCNAQIDKIKDCFVKEVVYTYMSWNYRLEKHKIE